MKTIKNLLFILFLFTSMIGLNSCSEDECQSKIVTIYCKNKPPYFSIYAIENTSTPIYDNEIKYGDTFEVELNIGNYMIWPGKKGFQVMPNKSTIITINNDQSTIEYK